ncbi:MAG TPA: hypothetical protein VKU80_02060 [Planctomycetota bacterium]|nr:hypothetical protein [Planctomycetota bacterium]
MRNDESNIREPHPDFSGGHKRRFSVPEEPFVARSPTEGGKKPWAFVILAAALAALTSPLWYFSPPMILGTADRFRALAIGVWFLIGVFALIAGRDREPGLKLDTSTRTVTRKSGGPWRTQVQWSCPGQRVKFVSLEVDAEGSARLQALLWGGSSFLIETGSSEKELRALGKELARCWQVPFRIGGFETRRF